MRFALFLAAAAIQISPAGAQVARSARLSPSPVLPPWGQPHIDGQFVYLGPTAHELTIFYPLRGADRTALGYEKSVRIQLLNRVAPSISATVERNPDGTFTYRYVVLNLPEARQPLRQWSLPVPAGVGSITAPEGWQFAADGPIEPDYRPQGPEQVSALGRTITLAWSTQGGLVPGAGQAGFTVRSAFAPALLRAFASSGDLTVPEDLPDEVREQLRVWQQVPWCCSPAAVIGPRYAEGFSLRVAAAEFYRALDELADERKLDPASDFVREALASLRALVSQENPFATGAIGLHFLRLASAEKEKEIGEAIRLTLSAP